MLLPVLGAIGFALAGASMGFGVLATGLATAVPWLLAAKTAILGATVSLTTLSGVLLTATGVVAAFFAGWEVGKIISASDAFGLLPITVGDAVQVAFSYLDVFFSRVKIGYLGIKKSIKDAFGFDTSAIDAQIEAEYRHIDAVHQVRDEIVAGKAEETAAHQQSTVEMDEKTAAIQAMKDKLAQPSTVKMDYTEAELNAMTFDEKFQAYRQIYAQPAQVGLDTAPATGSLDALQQKGISSVSDLSTALTGLGQSGITQGAVMSQGVSSGAANAENAHTAAVARMKDALQQLGLSGTEAGAQMMEGVTTESSMAALSLAKDVEGMNLDLESMGISGIEGISSIEGALQQMGVTGQGAAALIDSSLDTAAQPRTSEIKLMLQKLDYVKSQLADLTKDETKTITVTTVKKTVEGHLGGFMHSMGMLLAGGGKLAGYGGGDRIRALLEAGEFVIRKEAVKKYGAAMFNAFNNMALPATPSLAFQAGGVVPGPSGGNVNLSIPINISATGSDAGNMERMFRDSIIPQFKEALANNTKSITTSVRKAVG